MNFNWIIYIWLQFFSSPSHPYPHLSVITSHMKYRPHIDSHLATTIGDSLQKHGNGDSTMSSPKFRTGAEHNWRRPPHPLFTLFCRRFTRTECEGVGKKNDGTFTSRDWKEWKEISFDTPPLILRKIVFSSPASLVLISFKCDLDNA